MRGLAAGYPRIYCQCQLRDVIPLCETRLTPGWYREGGQCEFSFGCAGISPMIRGSKTDVAADMQAEGVWQEDHR